MAPTKLRAEDLETSALSSEIPESGLPFPVVGIGASAGGFQAFSELLRALPRDTGVAFVLIQHLAPKHESVLASLLSGETDMVVYEVKEGMNVEPNHVYVIPPNVSMGIMNGVLHLVPRLEPRGMHMPIDFFLRSLAEDQKGKAIGVVLSGTASDGAIGLKAIKAEGGITLAQSPESALYDGMPRSAIASGTVDFIGDVGGIAAELQKIAHHPYVRRPSHPAELLAGEADLQRIFFLLRSVSGVDFTHYKRATINRRIKRRMVLNKIERLDEYLVLLHNKPSEVQALYQDILIHVTGFFRDPEAFEVLKRIVFPLIVKERRSDSSIRIWVPACSTGEEPYSIAIALLEYLGEGASGVPIQIFGTDISQSAIDKARSGKYPENIAADITPGRLRRFFQPSETGYRISKTIRDLCIFACQDATKDPPFSKLDLISCRNMMIYLGPILQKRVISVFHYALNPVGYLMLGNSETIGSFSDMFATADRRHKIYVKRPGFVHRSESSGTLGPSIELVGGSGVDERSRMGVERSPATPVTLQTHIDRFLVDTFVPSAVAIDSTMKIVQVIGQTGKYLQPAPGEATLNLLKMTREGLSSELRAAIHAVRRRKVPVKRERIRVQTNGHTALVDLEVLPFDAPSHGGPLLLVVFRDHDGAAMSLDGNHPEPALIRKGSPSTRQRSSALERELKAMQGYLESVIQDQEGTNEELQSANEEILSANEELQSTNEELQTAKEELQSTNEELNTVNEELQTRNQELSLVNNDLSNLLASVSIPIIMVGNDLRIRRFTPMAEGLFNLIPSDVGRPISDIKSNLEMIELDQLIGETIDKVQIQEQEVRDKQGRWHMLRMRPYKSLDNRIEGAILAVFDIDEVKRGQMHFESVARQVESLVDICDQPLACLDGDMRISRGNLAFYEALGVSRDRALKRSIYDVAAGRWDLDRLRTLLEENLPREQRVMGFEVGLADRATTINAMLSGTNGGKLVIFSIQR